MFWLWWVFICCMQAFSNCGEMELWLQVRGRHELQPVGFRSCGSRALQRWLNSCDAPAQLLSCMWVIPGPEVKPVSPALQGGVPTTGPEGKPPVG